MCRLSLGFERLWLLLSFPLGFFWVFESFLIFCWGVQESPKFVEGPVFVEMFECGTNDGNSVG